jgi:hypothetical protein
MDSARVPALRFLRQASHPVMGYTQPQDAQVGMIVINNRLQLITAVVMVLSATYVHPCSLGGETSSTQMVKQADAIVRVRAVEYAIAPKDPNMFTNGEPDSMIRFKVLEVIRGRVSTELILPGYLVDHDDYNDQVSPYNFVRPNGRSGSCFANSYRSGGQFLLLLKKRQPGGYTVNWYWGGTRKRTTSLSR